MLSSNMGSYKDLPAHFSRNKSVVLESFSYEIKMAHNGISLLEVLKNNVNVNNNKKKVSPNEQFFSELVSPPLKQEMLIHSSNAAQ